MSVLQIPTAEAFEPLLEPCRYKGAWGGRGSGKSHFFAGHLVERALMERGFRGLCGREVQKSLKESAKRLIEDKISSFGLGSADGFKIFREVIETPGDGAIMFQGLQDHTAESINSFEGIDVFWGEEAQSISARSMGLLRPTIRKPGSELWFSWNPRRKIDPVDVMLRGAGLPTGSAVVKANWSDNPWFPTVLEQERLDCLRTTPDQYDHIWEGGYMSVAAGAYYAQSLALAKSQGRIGKVAADPMMTTRAIWDIGGTGAKADACAIWICQFVGKEIRVLDYYEAVGQPLATHVQWLRSQGYEKALCVLPHDGSTHDKVYDVSYESALRSAGFEVRVIPNQGAGAASLRIEAARRLFPSIWFHEVTTEAGRDALGWYHEKRDETRNIGLGPSHDWASHGCFLGETEVLTRYGTQRIMNLPETGEVLTPCGWKRYVLPRITKRNAQLVEVRFIGGYSVKCTPDHLFMTASGWRSAESLAPNTEILSTLTNSRSISTVVSTVCGRVTATCRAAARNFIATFGRLPSAQYRPVAIFTTGIATSSTTALKIWSAWTRRSMASCLGKQNQRQRTDSTSAQTPETRLLNGIDPQRGDFGIRGTPSALRVGPNGSGKKSPASIAPSRFRLLSGPVATAVNIVVRRAKSLLTGSVGKQMSGRVYIESVTKLSERSNVWDITVPDVHCFSLANGAVVHNSDAFGLMCVTYEDSAPKAWGQPNTRWVA